MTTLSLFDGHIAPRAATPPSAADRALSYYPTPCYIAEAIVGRYFSDLDSSSCVLEPTAGDGRFLRAIPAHVPAVGIELDPHRAQRARESTGRRVITGDVLTVPFDFLPTAVLGNPPFGLAFFEALLARVFPVLPEFGRVGLIVPAATLATSRTVVRLARQWSLQQEMLPRDLFPRLSMPLVFALLSKERRRTLVGFALYHEVAAARDLLPGAQALLAAGGAGGVWRTVVTETLRGLGGEASLQTIYDAIEGRRPTRNRFWREKVRQTLGQYHTRIEKGRYRLAVA